MKRSIIDKIRQDETAANIAMGLLFVVAVLFALGFAVVDAYFEAQAYEHVTGKHVSTWDAMFLDLRVQEPAK